MSRLTPLDLKESLKTAFLLLIMCKLLSYVQVTSIPIPSLSTTELTYSSKVTSIFTRI